MLQRLLGLGAVLGFVLLSSALLAFEVKVVIKKIDADKGVLVVMGGDRERTVKVAKDVKVSDEKGQALGDGLKAKELKEGAVVTLSVEREDNEPVIKAIRLGGQAAPSEAKAVTGGKTSFGLKPLSDMTDDDKYKGEDGGLYGAGKNEPPPAHHAAARKETEKVVPLDADGKPAQDGKIVLVSISMSNATQEFSFFKQIADADADKSPSLTIVDCAQGGQAMFQWTNPEAKAWVEADRRIAAARASPKQVQIAWVKLANVAPSGELNEHGKKLEKDTVAVLQNAKARFPNLRIAYLGSRTYGGYSTGRLNPEPYAYEGAFAARWLIQSQIKGDAGLNYDPERGAVKAPLLLWGPYLWADGVTPRKTDGFVWQRDDFGRDAVHPSQSGRKKVAELLLKFFKTDGQARTWFVKK